MRGSSAGEQTLAELGFEQNMSEFFLTLYPRGTDKLGATVMGLGPQQKEPVPAKAKKEMGCKVRGIEQGAAYRAGKRGSWRGSPRSFCLILSIFLPSYMGVYEVVGTSRPSPEIHFRQVNLCLRKFLCWTSADGVKGGGKGGVTNIIQEDKLLPLADHTQVLHH